MTDGSEETGDEAPDVAAAPEERDDHLIAMGSEERKAFLGKLVDFEMKLASLTDMQANFVLAVMRDPTSYTQAAKVAGFAHPNVACARLATKPKVADAIAAGMLLREDRTYVSGDRTLHELAILAFSDITNFVVDPDGGVSVREGVPEYATRAISSVEYERTTGGKEGAEWTKVRTKIRLWSKNDALRMLAIHQHLLAATTPGGVAVDNSKHVHLHQHQHNTWEIGGVRVTF